MRILDRAEPTPVGGLAPPGRTTGRWRALLTVVRPHQWVKNILVIPLPLATATTVTWSGWQRLCWSVLVFILASCLVYVGNDISDRHRDRMHPTKRHRAVASGLVPVPVAAAFAVGLLALLVVALSRQPWHDWWPVVAYLALNVAYSRGLKHVPMLDVLLVALGFELRLAQGYVALREPFSTWLPICVLGICVLLLVGKRRSEMSAGGERHRPALRGYSLPYLDQLLGLMAALVCVAFVAYLRTEAPLQQYRTAATLLCAPLAMLALFRYLQVAIVRDGSGDPARLLVRDRVMVVDALLCGVVLVTLTLFARYPHAVHTVLEKVS